MTTSIICERAFAFALRILKLADVVRKRGPAGYHIAQQLIGCGTSIGSNAEEAQEAQTKADFVAKLSVSRKESREVSYWLRLGFAANLIKKEEMSWELDEARQLLRMIRSAIKTARSRPDRGWSDG
jgi:four helix bundle protein